MSYDLAFYRIPSSADPGAVWDALRAEQPADVEPFEPEEVWSAFAAHFGDEVKREEGPAAEKISVLGPFFELSCGPGERLLYATCSWGALESPEGKRALASLRHVGCVLLGATCFNPQVEASRRPPKPSRRVPDVATDTPIAEMNRAELESLLRATRDEEIDREARRALGKRLREAGDPRGELVERGEPPKNIYPFVGPLLEAQMRAGELRGGFDATFFRYAHLQDVRVDGTKAPRRVRQLVDHPSAAFLRDLSSSLAGTFDEEAEEATTEIAEAPNAASLRSVSIGARAAGDLGALLTALPNLEQLSVSAGSFVLGSVVHAKLRTLTLGGARLLPRDFDALERSRFDALESLSLDAGGGAIDAERLARWLRSPSLARVTSLAFRGAANPLEIADVVLASPLAARLRELEVTPASDALLDALVRGASKLPVVEILSVADAAACSDDAALAAWKALGSKLIAPHPAISAARKAAKKTASPPTAAPPAPPAPLRAGDRVTHAKFGGGEVKAVQPNGNLTIRFDDGAEKSLAASFVKPA